MPNKIVSLLMPGLANTDVNGVRFNALAVTPDIAEGELTTFVLEVEEALHLGERLMHAAQEVLSREQQSQEDTIRGMEEG